MKSDLQHTGLQQSYFLSRAKQTVSDTCVYNKKTMYLSISD